MRLWRIATETRTYAAADLSGQGAALHPGRWNAAGQPVVYAAPTLALAVLETVAHMHDGGLPLNRFVVAIDLPPRAWAARRTLMPQDLPATWQAIPPGLASASVGSAWLAQASSLVLLVPSVIVPEEPVALLNPAHPAAQHMVAKAVRPFQYDRVMRALG